MMRDPGPEARIAFKKRVHPVVIAGQDDDQIVTLVFHDLEKNLDRFLPVIAFIFRAIEIIRLIDEQHAAHRLLQHLLRLRRGMANVLAHEIVARDGDEMAFADIAQLMQQFGHPQGDGGFSGAGIAGEAHMQRRRILREAELFARLIDEEEGGRFPDALFDRREPNQLLIQLVEDGAHAGGFERGAQIDRGFVRRGFGDRSIHGDSP